MGSGTGFITMNNVGNYEFRQILWFFETEFVRILQLDSPLTLVVFQYITVFQVVLVPFCDIVHIPVAIAIPKWDGKTGGVIAIFANKLNMTSSISASGTGYRGAPSYQGTAGTTLQYAISNATGLSFGYKGEGICGHGYYNTIQQDSTYDSENDLSRGGPGNGGGEAA
jgi:hypothetical protein